MKKFIFIISAGLFGSLCYGQANSSAPSVKTMTVEEANRLNGVAQPTINGKPYAQYKAEQDALKVRQQQAQPVRQPQEVTMTPGNMPARQQPVQVNTLKGNETAEPAPMVNTKVESPARQASKDPVVHVAPSMDASSPNAAVVPVEKKATGPERPAQVSPKVSAPVTEASQPQQEVIPAMPAGVKLEKGPVQVEKTTEPKADPSSSDSQPNPQAKTKTN